MRPTNDPYLKNGESRRIERAGERRERENGESGRTERAGDRRERENGGSGRVGERGEQAGELSEWEN